MLNRIPTICTFVLALFFIYGCEQSTQNQADHQSKVEVSENPNTPKRVLPTSLSNALKAHDPAGKWDQMKSLTFTIDKGGENEVHLFNLENRQGLISGKDYQIGFDGKDVWVAPDKEVYKGNARFYHSVYFYFFAMPYVLADPGIKYKALPVKEYLGTQYNPVSITYNAGVGDAPDDEYIAYFNAETNLMELLMYTVTYKKDGPSEKYSVWNYSDWQVVNGISLPKTMTRYKLVDDQLELGEAERTFLDVSISENAPDPNKFKRPEKSVIDEG